MELSQLRAILTLRELASLAKVGEQLHLSPSAVFCQIRQLEDEIGEKLYERIGKSLRLTATGALLVDYAAKIVQTHDSALAALKEQGTSHRELLRLGCGPHSGMRVVPNLLRAFVAAHPSTEVRLATSTDEALLHDVRIGLLDVILMSLPAGEPELHEDPLWSYEMVMVPPSESGLFPKVSGVEDLRKAPFILYRRTVAIDSAYRRLCRTLGFELNVVMENAEVESIKELVKLGLGITFLPLWSVGDDAKTGALRIMECPVREFHNYGLLYRKTEYHPKALSGLVAVAHRWRDWWPLREHVSRRSDLHSPSGPREIRTHAKGHAGPLGRCNRPHCGRRSPELMFRRLQHRVRKLSISDLNTSDRLVLKRGPLTKRDTTRPMSQCIRDPIPGNRLPASRIARTSTRGRPLQREGPAHRFQ